MEAAEESAEITLSAASVARAFSATRENNRLDMQCLLFNPSRCTECKCAIYKGLNGAALLAWKDSKPNYAFRSFYQYATEETAAVLLTGQLSNPSLTM